MGRLTGEGSDTKSQLATNICDISNRAISCARLHRPPQNPIISPFVDWYLLLQVEENVGIDVIRKQYHKFALLLHPDKNKHPKAEIAFKLVYEAYACLKDNTRRAAFDLERGNSFCKECNKFPPTTSNPTIKTTTTKLMGLFTKERLRANKILQGMNDIKARFREEAGVIEKCLKVTAASRRENPTCNAFRKGIPVFNPSQKDIPVFNPSDYLSQGYPHYRTRNYTKPKSFWCLHTGKTYTQRKEKCDSPVFESKSERRPVKFAPVCLDP